MNEAGVLLALLYRPYFSPAVIGLAVVGTMALAVWAWRRRSVGRGVAAASGLVMRLIGIGVIGFLLLGPSTLPEQDTDPTRSPVHFLVDASGSMQTQDLHLDENSEAVSRYRFAFERWLDADTIAALEAQHDVRIYSFGDRVRATLPEVDDATHRQSNVVESTYDLLSTMNNTQDGSVVILSDGRDSRDADATAAVQLARARDINLHTVTLGGSTLMRDVSLIATPRQPYLMVNEPGQIDVRLQHINAAGANATLRIRQGDEETTRSVTLTDDARLRLDLPIEHDEPGLKVYELSIDQLPGEPEPSNNTQTVFVEVTAERMRVLLLEGQPYWDTKFLAQSLRKDDRLELTHITQINRDRQERIVTRADRVAVAPRNLEEWAEYDVVILGRGMQNVLSVAAAEALPAYVGERGGRVVLARGRSYDAATRNGRAIGRAVAVLEPVIWANGRRTDTRLTPTDAGRRHPMFAGLMRATGDAPSPRDLPTLGRAANLESLKPATRVLAATARDGDDENALLVSMPYGRGMVVALLGEGLWRWSLAGSNDETMAGVFDSFWSNAVRWLVLGSDADAGQDLSIRLSERSVALEDELLVTVVQRGDAADLDVEAVVTDPAGKQTSLSLQDFAGTDQRRTGGYRPTVAGVHTLAVRAVGDTPTNPGDEAIEPVETPFIAYDGNTELLRTAADPVLMRSLAVGSGGEVLNPDNPAALLDVLSRQQAARFVPPVPEYVWDRGWVMALLLIWIGLEWIVRKKGGLL